jgi:hypothetical protein
MRKIKHRNSPGDVALFAGATALMAFAAPTAAQTSVDALLNKLEQKGILTVEEARQLKAENQQDTAADLNKAFNSRFQMPDWVTSYKLYGDFRGRFDEMTTENPGDPNPAGTNPTGGLSGQDRVRWRYRIRLGLDVNLKDNLQAGLRLGSGDGNALSNNQTEQDNGTKKAIWVDTAYGKWTPLNDGVWMLAATFGKMDQPFQVSSMEFDPDYTPEGAALQAKYTISEKHSLAFNTAGFVLDEVKGSARDPFLVGAQAIWNASWTSRIASSLGFGAFNIINPDALGVYYPTSSPDIPAANYNANGVPYNNRGNTRNATTGNLVYNYNPIVAGASATYTLDSFPLYKGKFPIKASGEYMYNGGAEPKTGDANNIGWWAGIQLGKSGKQGTWDVSYRYQYLEADAWYDEMVDDDAVVFYSDPNTPATLTPPQNARGWFAGTNIKGHQIKFNYSLTDALTFSFSAYLNEMIHATYDQSAGSVSEPQNNSMHFMADLMWKF